MYDIEENKNHVHIIDNLLSCRQLYKYIHMQKKNKNCSIEIQNLLKT